MGILQLKYFETIMMIRHIQKSLAKTFINIIKWSTIICRPAFGFAFISFIPYLSPQYFLFTFSLLIFSDRKDLLCVAIFSILASKKQPCIGWPLASLSRFRQSHVVNKTSWGLPISYFYWYYFLAKAKEFIQCYSGIEARASLLLPIKSVHNTHCKVLSISCP